MKKIIIVVVVIVSCYAAVGSELVGRGVEVAKNHNAQLEEVMKW